MSDLTGKEFESNVILNRFKTYIYSINLYFMLESNVILNRFKTNTTLILATVGLRVMLS